MGVTGIFDRLFVNHLFGINERGETIYYPHGRTSRGFLVPPEREPGVRSGLRWLVLIAVIGGNALALLVPRLLESLGLDVPLGWFIGGALVALVTVVWGIIFCLGRLAAGLAPVSARD